MREYKIDIRGLDGRLDGLRVSEILAMVRAEVLDMKRWSVQGDVYLANFSFARYAMWNGRPPEHRRVPREPAHRLPARKPACCCRATPSRAGERTTTPPADVLCPLTAGRLAVRGGRRGGIGGDIRAARPARHRQEPDHHQHHRQLPLPRQAGAVRRRKAGGALRRQKEA